jgi:predicted dinucleotide-binding enzyme
MNIAIVGAGRVGLALGAGWLKTGHKVTFAVREHAGSKAAELKKQGFGVVAVNEAAAAGDLIVLAIPWSAVAATVAALGSLEGKIIVDATNPLRPGYKLAIGFDDSAGETVARLAKGAAVVKAFNMTGAENMANAAAFAVKPLMLLAGDDAGAKATVSALAAELGFEAVDAGPLTMSRQLESMATLWITLAYAQNLGRDFAFAIVRR